MLQSFALYDRLGLARVLVHAGLQTGRYYWAGRVGFDFADEIQRRHVERWAVYVLGAMRLEHDLTGVEEPQQWALLGTEVDPEVTTTFAALDAALPARLPYALLDPNGTHVIGYRPAAEVSAGSGFVDRAAHLDSIRTGNGIDPHEPVGLGKIIMLTGPDWYGTLDLT